MSNSPQPSWRTRRAVLTTLACLAAAAALILALWALRGGSDEDAADLAETERPAAVAPSAAELEKIRPLQAAIDAAFGRPEAAAAVAPGVRWRLLRTSLALLAAARSENAPPDPNDPSAALDDGRSLETLLGALEPVAPVAGQGGHLRTLRHPPYGPDFDLLALDAAGRLLAIRIGAPGLAVAGVSVGQGWEQARSILGRPPREPRSAADSENDSAQVVDYPAMGVELTLDARSPRRQLEKLAGRDGGLEVAEIRLYDNSVNVRVDGRHDAEPGGAAR